MEEWSAVSLEPAGKLRGKHRLVLVLIRCFKSGMQGTGRRVWFRFVVRSWGEHSMEWGKSKRSRGPSTGSGTELRSVSLSNTCGFAAWRGGIGEEAYAEARKGDVRRYRL
jgi:hypothetical protein